MTRVIAIGECMVELSPSGADSFTRSYAGDVYNTAVYLHRLGSGLSVAFMTVLGKDLLSEDMVSLWDAEGLDGSLIYRDEVAHPGMYMIETDDEGERTFLYWRGESAARRLIPHLLKNSGADALCAADYIFLSGITVAILDTQSRKTLWELLATARKAGTRIIFDPNYRPKLWESKEAAHDEIERGFQVADIALPGMEDERTLFHRHTAQETMSALQRHGVQEAIIKDGKRNVFILHRDQLTEFHIEESDRVVDTTGAGDAFNAAYLAARLNGGTPKFAVAQGAKLAAFVISQRGAVVPRDIFEEFRRTL